MLKSVELFTGAGGLALGIHEAGFEHVAIAERDKHSVATLRFNKSLFGLPPDYVIESTDVNKVDWRPYADQVDLVAGGVPCQPFSLGGKHLGQDDQRNLFPEMIRAVREIRPSAVLIENVKGLLRPSFAPFFEYVLRELEMPEIVARAGEQWFEHDARLLAERRSLGGGGLRYRVRHQLIQCANYGVPQQRERVVVVAYRSDLERVWEPPVATHSEERLVYEQDVTGTYWKEHGLGRRRRSRRNEVLRLVDGRPKGLEAEQWRTVRDALRGLPAPARNRVGEHGGDICLACHWGNPGARAYPGHDGSNMDWPAKTLKAGVHGVPGGENMLRNTNGTIRYFSAREAARLQTFPDDCHFLGSWGESFRQLGNAVPVLMAKAVAQQIASTVASATAREAREEELVASG